MDQTPCNVNNMTGSPQHNCGVRFGGEECVFEDEGALKEMNRDRVRQLWIIISTGLWIDVKFVGWLWKHLDRLSGAPRGLLSKLHIELY